MIDDAGEQGVSAIVIDLGKPIEKWYGETWIRFECDATSNVNTADGSVVCKLGDTIANATTHVQHDCSIMVSQSVSYSPIYNKYKNRINVFTHWYDNKPYGTTSQHNGFSASNYPVNTYATANKPDASHTAIGKRYLGF